MQTTRHRASRLVVFAILHGCAPQETPLATSIPVRPPPRPVLVSGDARVYNPPFARGPESPIGSAIATEVADIARRSGNVAPVSDARLFHACAALASVMPFRGRIAYPTVEFALQSNGIIEPSPHLLIVEGYLNRSDQLAEALEPALAQILEHEHVVRFGVGTFEAAHYGPGVVVVALQGSHVRTRQIPRAVPVGATIAFGFELEPGYRSPIVTVARPGGDTEEIRIDNGWDGYYAKIACGPVSGRLQIEIEASGVRGNEVLANFPVWCGEEPPRSVATQVRSTDLPASPADAEQRMAALVNDERARHGRSPLVWDEELAKIARAHSQQMRQSGIVAFSLPGIGSVEDKVRAVRNHTAIYTNVAREYGIEEAQRGMFGVPSIRAKLIDASTTHIAIGIVYGEQIARGMQELFVTEVVTAPEH